MEIRLNIFDLVVGGNLIKVKFSGQNGTPGLVMDKTQIPEMATQILPVCKLWAKEALPILYGRNTFYVENMEQFDRAFLPKIGSANTSLIRQLVILEKPCDVPTQVHLDAILRWHPGFRNLQSIDVTLADCSKFLSQFATGKDQEQATKERIMWSLYRIQKRVPNLEIMVEKQKLEGSVRVGIRLKTLKAHHNVGNLPLSFFITHICIGDIDRQIRRSVLR